MGERKKWVRTKKVEGIERVGQVRDEKGRFLPGVVFPTVVTSSARRAYKRAVLERVPPELIAEWLLKAAEMAMEKGHVTGLVAVAELALSYGAGKPGVVVDDDEARPSLVDMLQVAMNGGVVVEEAVEVDGVVIDGE